MALSFRAIKTCTQRRLFSRSYSGVLDKWPKTQVSELSNGIRVATEPMAGQTATVGVWIDTGSRYESERTNGVAHFLEHMFFKGTENRTKRDLEEGIENMGGHLNAYTSREQTVFYAKVFKDDVPQALEILADMIQNSKYAPVDIERERDTILREMQEVENMPEEVIFDRLHHTAYRGTALARTILGPEENIRSFSRDDIEQYRATHYVGPRMVIAAAGPVEHAEIERLAESLFSDVPKSGDVEPYMEPAVFTGSDIRVRFDDLPVAHVAYAFPTAGWQDPDNFPLLVIQHLLGSWDRNCYSNITNTKMTKEIAEDGLAHSVAAFNTQYSDTGLFGVHAVCEGTLQDALMYYICGGITDLCYHVEENALEQAKTHLKMTMLGQLDGSTVVCEDIGRQVLTYGRRMHPLETLARIDAVDTNAVKRCANRYFLDRDFALAAVGPIWELPDYQCLRRRTFYNRY